MAAAPSAEQSKNQSSAEEYFELGVEALQTGRLDEAIEYLTKAIQLNPDFAEAYNHRGNAYLRKKELDRAIQDFNRVIELKPDWTEAYLTRSMAYLQKRDLEKAFSDFNEARKLDPNNEKFLLLGGALYALKREWQSAIDNFTKGVEFLEGTKTSERLLALFYEIRGICYFALHVWENAIADFTKALEKNAQMTEAYTMRGRVYVLKKELKKAAADYHKALKLNPNEADVHLLGGILYGFKRKLKKAIAECNKAVKLEPNLREAWLLRGFLYLDTGVWQDAVSDFNKTIELDSKCAEAYFTRAAVYYSVGALEMALQDAATLEEIVTETKDKARLEILKGKLALAENKFPEAIQHFQKAGALSPTEIITHLWRIYVQYLEITFKTQLDIYSNSNEKINISEHPDFQKELNSLITQLSELKRFLEKERARQWWGTQNFFQRRLKELMQLFSFRKDPEVEQLKTIDYWLGVLYYQLNDFSHAIENLEAACQLDKNFKEARSLLGSIWNFSCRPTWWRWWFCAPTPLYSWGKWIVGFLLLLTAWGAVLAPLCGFASKTNNPIYYIAPAILAVAILLSPVLSYLRAGPVEVEIMISPPPGSFFSHPAMEDILKRTEIWSFMESIAIFQGLT